MTADKPSNLVPKLRFSEFRSAGDWLFQPLSDIAKPISERVGMSNCVPMSVTTGVGLLSQEEKFGRIIAGNEYKNYIRLQTNDFAYNKSATKEFPQGYIARYSGTRGAAVPKSIFTCFRPDAAAVIPEYLDHLLHGNHHGRWLRKYITVGARAHGALSVSDDALMSMPVPLPPVAVSRREQQKIADCLGLLDDLIAAEGRKLECLQQHKQGLMQQLFPQPGETVPRLRFPEFRDEPRWDFLTLSSASDVNPSNDGLPELFIYIDLESVKSSMLIERKEVTRDAAPSRAQRLLSRKDIIYQTVRPYQRNNFFFNISDGYNYVASTGYAQIRAHECPEFLYQILHTDSFVNSILARCTGSNYPAINPSVLASIRVALPRKREQQKIADCLGSLDDLIAAERRKLESLRQHKQGLMQQLFPSLEAQSR